MLVTLIIVIVVQWLRVAHPILGHFFKEKPENQSVLIGEDVLLKCSANLSLSGTILFSQWRSNDGTLLGFHDAGKLAGHDGRYSYVSNNPGENHLHIENVALEDDGVFECQMMHPSLGAYRTSAVVTVLVPPSDVFIVDNAPNSVIAVSEGDDLNLTCVAVGGKPQAVITWYVHGERIGDFVKQWTELNTNHTVTARSAIVWRPGRSDNGTILSCEAVHQETLTRSRVNLTLNVLYPSGVPKIDLLSGFGSIKPGENVTLRCSVVGGNPPPRLVWLFHHNPIDINYTYDALTEKTVNIYSMVVHASDNGAVYECQSTSSAGTAPLIDSIRLSVPFAPRGVELSGDTITRLGRSVPVHCRTGLSNPAPRISWLINGQPAESIGDAYLEQFNGIVATSNITVNPTDVSIINHQITVQCVAQNDEGMASKQLVVRVLSPPIEPVIFGLEEMALLEGEYLNLTCESRGGNPLPTLTWFRGIEKLREARNTVTGDISRSTISFLLDRTLNNQQLRCEAKSEALDESLIAAKKINVFCMSLKNFPLKYFFPINRKETDFLYESSRNSPSVPPRRVVIRQDDRSGKQMVEGNITRLFCLVHSSNPVAEITWDFLDVGGIQIFYEEKHSSRPGGEYGGYEVESVIQFVPAEAMDGSEVHCTALHPKWASQKVAVYLLNVLYPPKMVFTDPLTVVVGEGGNFHKNLTIRANPPVSTWRWRKDGLLFEHMVGAVTARESVLSGYSVTRFDSGLFTLAAGNSLGSINISVRITVEYAAYVTHITSPVIASAGEEVVMECEVDGWPKRDGMVKWLRGEQLIENISFVGQTRAVMRFNASLGTSGAYTCLADNGIGMANRTIAYLLVNRAPTIIRQPAFLRTAGPVNGRARLRCRAHAVPDAHFQWTIQGHPTPILRNSSKYSFTTLQLNHSVFEGLFYVSSLDHYDYQHPVKCIVINKYGEDAVDIRISPLTAPDTPTGLRISNITTDSLSLNWVPGFDGGSEQIFEVRYHTPSENFYHVINSSFPKVEIKGLEPAHLYEIAIRAVNNRGQASEFSRPPVIAYTKDKYGADVVNMEKKVPLSVSVIVVFGVCCVIMLLTNSILLCHMHHRKRKENMQEKTEIVRAANTNGSDLKPVQMYGPMTNISNSCRLLSTNTSRGELGHEPNSDDYQSLRTVLEVNPSGYVQQVNPTHYHERECMVQYEDPSLYGDLTNSSTLRGTTNNYANLCYSDKSSQKVLDKDAKVKKYSNGGSLSGVTDMNPINSLCRIRKPRIISAYAVTNLNINNNNNSNGTPQILSTFVQRSQIHATLNYANIDGDLV